MPSQEVDASTLTGNDKKPPKNSQIKDNKTTCSSTQSLLHTKVPAVLREHKQTFVYLPDEEDENCQHQKQSDDCQKDDPPGNFDNVLDLFLKENCHFYLRTARSQVEGDSHVETEQACLF